MRTDAILFSVNSTKEKQVSNRMDCTRNNADDYSATGFGKENQTTSQVRFKETYDQVAKSNSVAKRAAEFSVKDHSNQNVSEKNMASRNKIDQVDAEDHSKIEEPKVSGIQQKDVSRNSQTEDIKKDALPEDKNDTDQITDASEIIKQALLDISDALQLKVAPGLDQVSFESATNETVEQFAQIVHDLKTIIGALDTAAAQGESIDTGKKVIEGVDAGELVSKLKTELFKIEIGINMLGKSEDVQNKLAQMNDVPFSSGIPQATDPAELSMSADQARKLFSEALNSSEDSSNVSKLVKKLNELVKENSPDAAPVKITAAPDTKPAVSDVTPFTTQTFRAMLKIETKEQVVSENADAAKSGKLELSESANGVLAKDVTVQPARLSEQVIAVNEIAAKVHQTQDNMLQEIRTPVNLTKTLEQSVVNQITDKLNTAVRSGITEVRVQLRPEALGDVTLKIRIEGDVVTAKMQVENQQVKAIIENGFQSLKDTLAQHNLQTGSFEVNVQSGDRDPNAQGQEFMKHQSSSGHHTVASNGDSQEPELVETDGISLSETGRRFGNNTVEYFG